MTLGQHLGSLPDPNPLEGFFLGYCILSEKLGALFSGFKNVMRSIIKRKKRM